jgi:Domain of unknown function (DUF5122) beta-propeller
MRAGMQKVAGAATCLVALGLALVPAAVGSAPVRVSDLSFDSHKRIVVSVAGRERLEIVRLDGSGELDRSFAGDGVLRPRVDGRGARTAVDGSRILVAGIFRGRRVLRSYLANGRPDRRFGVRGVVRTSPFRVRELMVQPRARVVAPSIGGCSAKNCGYAFNNLDISRYTRRGRRIAFRSVYSELWGMGGAAMGPGGRFVVSGGDYELGYESLARFRPDGRIDPGLGGRGGLNLDVEEVGGGEEEESDNDVVYAKLLAVQPDRKIVLVTGRRDLSRRNAEGSLDTGFGSGGTVRCGTTPSWAGPGFSGVRVSVGATLLAAGGAGGCGLVRYLPDGGLDPSFGDGGMVDVGAGGAPRAQALGAAPGGICAIAGTDSGDGAVRVAVFDAAGAPSSGFGNTGVVTLPAP